jgi:hypothetical protein
MADLVDDVLFIYSGINSFHSGTRGCSEAAPSSANPLVRTGFDVEANG